MIVANFRTIKDSVAIKIEGGSHPEGFCQDNWIVTYADGRQERIKYPDNTTEAEIKKHGKKETA